MAGLGSNFSAGVKLNTFGENTGALSQVGRLKPATVGVAPPPAVAAPAVASAAAQPFSWWDASKLGAAQQAQGVGADGRTILQGGYLAGTLNPITGVTSTGPGTYGSMTIGSGGDSGQSTTSQYYMPGSYSTGSNGVTLQSLLGDPGSQLYADEAAYNTAAQAEAARLGLDPTGKYAVGHFENPTGNGDKDQVSAYYKIDANGNAVPVGAQSQYAPHDWVDFNRQAAIMAAIAAATAGYGAYASGAAGAGGAAAGAGAGASDAALVSGMDLAADAGVMGANGIGGAGAMFGPGVGLATAAPAYGGVGTSGAGAGTDAIVNGSAGAASNGVLGSGLSASQILNGAKAVAPILGGLGGGGGASGAGGALGTAAPTDMGKAAVYDYKGFTPTMPASRPGHTMGPSNAVNLNDPSAAMFGYGATPTYYKKPMAEGGAVDESITDRPSATVAPTSTDVASLYGPQGYTGDAGNWYDPATSWLSRLAAGDKKTGGQFAMGMGTLGLLASLLSKKRGNPGFQSVADLRAGLPGGGNMTPQQMASMRDYFNAPASRYVPPPAPAGPGVVTVGNSARMADGGRAEPKVGTRGPVRTGGGGGLSPEIVAAVLAARAQQPAGSVGPTPGTMAALPANPVTDPGAILAARMRSQGLAQGGSPYVPSVHGNHVPGDSPGQSDVVPADLSPGEYVLDADLVSSLGDGNNAAGAAALDDFRERVRAHKRGAPNDRIPPAALSPLQYMKMGAK